MPNSGESAPDAAAAARHLASRLEERQQMLFFRRKDLADVEQILRT